METELREVLEVKWLKRWAFLLLFAVIGITYFTVTDNWKMYAEPFAKWQEQWDNNRTEGSADASDPGAGETGRENFPSGEGAGETGNQDLPSGEGVGETGRENFPSGEGAGETGNQDLPSGEGVGETGNQDLPSGETTGTASTSQQPLYFTVGDDYFADAVFIGDSRTVGMYEYGGLEETATFYASSGLTVYKLFSAEIVSVPGQKRKLSVEEALQSCSFSKIYLMIGINEMGTGTVETFIKKYEEVLQHLQELQPDAIIYIQGIMKVSTERSEQGDYINNEGIEARNAELEKLADNRRLFYLDVNPQICDETGGLISSYTFDGVHLKAKYVEIWKEFLKEHAVSNVQE